MKKIALVIAILVSSLFPAVGVNAAEPLPKLKEPVYTQDNANLLSSSDVTALNDLGNQLEHGTTAEILLMTMPTIGQENRQDYAFRAGREYGVGQKDKDNGIVILFNLDNNNEYTNRGISVQVGYGLEGVLNDAKVGALIDQYAMPDLKKAVALDPTGKSAESKALYTSGLTKLYKAIWKVVADSYGWDGKTFTRDEPIQNNSDDGGISIYEILIGMFILFIIFNMFFGGRGGGPGGRRRGGVGPVIFFPTGGGFSSGGFSSGGFGGSGGFDGGGFGGGDFGGGGADRGF